MMFSKRIQRAMDLLHERREERAAQQGEDSMPLEKGDFAAMTLSAYVTLLVPALIVLLVITGVAALWIL